MTIAVDYVPVPQCPLCGSNGRRAGAIRRASYRFGNLDVAMPGAEAVLQVCASCALVWKDQMPTPQALGAILTAAAQDVWSDIGRDDPAAEWVRPYLTPGASLLDFGTGHGDLLRLLAPDAARRSAFDAIRYPPAAQWVSGEYLTGLFEAPLPDWSGEPYDVVTALDVFEHFLDPNAALANLVALLRPGGRLIVETGDWRHYCGNLDRWYYLHHFEHQLAWTRTTFDYAAARHGLTVIRYDQVDHKLRRTTPLVKAIKLEILHNAQFLPFGTALMQRIKSIDPREVSRPHERDHVFAVLEKMA
jgi:SAM-dependent methyltransferase